MALSPNVEKDVAELRDVAQKMRECADAIDVVINTREKSEEEQIASVANFAQKMIALQRRIDAL